MNRLTPMLKFDDQNKAAPFSSIIAFTRSRFANQPVVPETTGTPALKADA